jgi:hypothetical protein
LANVVTRTKLFLNDPECATRKSEVKSGNCMRHLIKWLSQILAIIAACLSGHYSLIDFLGMQKGNHVQLGPWIPSGSKEQVELELKIAILLSALILSAIIDLVDYYWPQKKISEVRKKYLKLMSDEFKSKIAQTELRISICYAKRGWFWPFWKTFDIVWCEGYAPGQDKEKTLRLATWQGVSGLAFRSCAPSRLEQRVTLSVLSWPRKWLLLNDYRMTYWQIKKAGNIVDFFSIPMVEKGEDGKLDRSSGVVNIGTITSKGARELDLNRQALQDYFLDKGKTLALFNL